MAVVGGGIMGLSAALHAARLGLSVRVVDAQKHRRRRVGAEWRPGHPRPEIRSGMAARAFRRRARRGADRVRRLDRRRRLRPDPRREAGGAVRAQWLDPGSAYRDRLARRREPRPPVAGPRRRRPPARCRRDRGDDRRARLCRRLARPPGGRHRSARLHARAGAHRQGCRRAHRRAGDGDRAAARGRRLAACRRRRAPSSAPSRWSWRPMPIPTG